MQAHATIETIANENENENFQFMFYPPTPLCTRRGCSDDLGGADIFASSESAANPAPQAIAPLAFRKDRRRMVSQSESKDLL
jgi:hypothetical protein